MSGKELIDSLRTAAEQKFRALQSETDAEIEAIRRRTAERIAQMRREAAERQAAEVRDIVVRLRADATREARTVRLEAEHRLAERLLAIARASLQELRGQDDDSLFAGLAAELPQLDWETVRVHPADLGRARAFFPRATIAADEAVTGGMDASTAGGRIRVVNTLEIRLARLWPELLPELMAAVLREAVEHGAVGAA